MIKFEFLCSTFWHKKRHFQGESLANKWLSYVRVNQKKRFICAQHELTWQKLFCKFLRVNRWADDNRKRFDPICLITHLYKFIIYFKITCVIRLIILRKSIRIYHLAIDGLRCLCPTYTLFFEIQKLGELIGWQ